jgi:uncharacterized protein (TIGR02145 family)
MLSDSHNKVDYTCGNFKVSKLDIKNIDVIKVRRKGAGAAVVIGGVSGMVLGAIISIAYANAHTQQGVLGEPVPVAESFIPFFLSTAIGFGSGILLASKIKIPINSKQATYEMNREKLNEYAIMNNMPRVAVKGGSFSVLPDSVYDIDGNYYHILALGGQVWMAENLETAHYRNGDSIIEVKENSEWGKTVEPATCGYKNNMAGGRMYGRLYNWNAVADLRGLCPKGWHVPSASDLESLVESLGGGTEAGKKILNVISQRADGKSAATTFSNPFAHPAGFRFNTGQFSSDESPSCQWWSSTAQDPAVAKSLQLGDIENGVFFTGSDKSSGLSVRCLRD